MHQLLVKGKPQIRNKRIYFEVLNAQVSAESLNIEGSKVDMAYVEFKLVEYQKQIELAILKRDKDTNTRQSIIQFDCMADVPNCMSNINFQAQDDFLHVFINQRSMHLDMYHTDMMIVKSIVEMMTKSVEYKNVYYHLQINNFHI